MDSAAHLPADSTLLPVATGQLLVSPGHAVFCHVPAAEERAMRGVLADGCDLSALGNGLRLELERHGFFGPPRPTEPDPPSVQIQLTNGCNLACSYCCTNSGRVRQRELDLAPLCRVVDQIHEAMGSARVALLGGEPLLVPWALEVAERVVERGHELTLFTNGTLLGDEEVARRAAALTERGAQLRVSLAGPTAELCDGPSGAPRFEAALAGIRQVHRLGGQVVVDLMVLPKQVDALAAHFHELRVRLPAGAQVALGLLYLSGRETGEHLFASRSALESALDRVAFEAGEAIAAPASSPLAFRREGCGCAMGNHLHLRSDGALFSCFKMEERVGDLATEGFVEVARRVRANPHPATRLAFCADCPLATLCGGGCRSDNLLYTGDGDTPVCGPWRVRVLSELLAEDRVTAVDWPVYQLLAEAQCRGIDAPERITPCQPSRHLRET